MWRSTCEGYVRLMSVFVCVDVKMLLQKVIIEGSILRLPDLYIVMMYT